MKMRRVLSAFLAVVCIMSTFGFCTLGVSAEDTRPVYATTSASTQQGSYGYCYVYLDDLTDLATLTVAVHYDAETVTVQSSYNQVACEMYDSSSKDGCLQFTYIFDGKGSNQKTNLFYFQYRVNDTAALGDAYFDIVVSDAHNAALDVVNVVGSRCAFTVTERVTAKTCNIYSSSALSTAVRGEFTVSYRISTSQIASGSFTVQYDPELFAFVELTQGSFLDGKIADVNASMDGAVAVSFAGTSYNYNYDLVTVKFRTLKNADVRSDIVLKVTELCDTELNLLQCGGCTTAVTVTYDPTYTEDSPAMFLSAVYDEEGNNVTLSVHIEADSHLGAGDFELRFDPAMLTYVSSEKEFAPTFFQINEKNVADGVLKFSIISLSDITDAQNVLTVTFDALRADEEQTATFEISGIELTDALTNAITLNFVGCDVTVPISVRYGDANDDGVINLIDSILLRNYLAEYDYDTGESSVAVGNGADVNGDGRINLMDSILLSSYLAAYDYETGESDVVLGPVK